MTAQNEQSQLFVVGTPIGNMEDMSVRAIETLKKVDAIASEDTRRAGLLKKRFEIETPLISLHEHNEKARSGELLERLEQGESIALVTDAGMPVVSDPGAYLVAAAKEVDIPVVVIPGPSAVTCALAGSGFRGDRFRFEGFPPKKKAAMERWLEGLKEETAAVVCFESPYRLVKTLEAIASVLGNIPVVVGREMTKLHEELRKASVEELLEHYRNKTAKGECTLVFVPKESKKSSDSR